MRKVYVFLTVCLAVSMAGTTFGQTAKDTHDEIEQTTKSATIFKADHERPRQGDSARHP